MPAGWWELRRLPGDYAPSSFDATLVADRDGEPVPVWATQAANLSSLEETLGWTLPADSRHVLLAAAPALPPRGTGGHGGDVPLAVAHRPTRASVVERAGKPTTTYGRLLHTETPGRVHRDGPVQILLHAGLSDTGPVLVYRVSETTPDRLPTLMFCAARTLDPEERLDADDEIRSVAGHLLDLSSAGEASPRQLAFLHRHTTRLATLAAGPPAHPYPPGTRVVVHPDDPHLRATGTVLATVDGDTGYLWRPDTADLPGHPWATHPTWALPVRRADTHATLDPPDTDLSVPQPGDGTNPYRPSVLSTGALVATIDDARFTTATVLRVFDDDEHGLRYEVQPHDAPLPPQLLPADDLTALRPAAWPTVEALVRARITGHLPPTPGEALVTVQEIGLVLDDDLDGFGVIPVTPAPWTTCPTLVPDPFLTETAAASATRTPAAYLARPAPTIRHSGDTIHLRDPLLGHLAVPADLYTRALRQTPAALTALLARRPWIPTHPDQPHTITAALAAQYAPTELTAPTAGHDPAPAEPDLAAPEPEAPPTATPTDVTTAPELPDPGLSAEPG